MKQSLQNTHEAVVFFDREEISKEMHYAEFEALLDCVVPMQEFAGRVIEAAYLRLDANLSVVGLVLFLVPFDEEGFVEQSWNVPLRQLVEGGTRGPDLGGGPVRIATRSQCPVKGQESKLWDIRFTTAGNTLNLLQERLRDNRLGIDVIEAPPMSAPPAAAAPPAMPQYAPAPAAAAPASSSESTDAVLQIMQQSSAQMAMLKEQHQRELMSLQENISQLQQKLQVQENEKDVLAGQLEQQAAALDAERREAERKARQLAKDTRAQTAALKLELKSELEAAVASRERELKAEIESLKRERDASEEQLHGLTTEVTELRRDRIRLMGSGADKFFERLKEKAVKFVSYQPGAGHLTVPMEDLSRFLDDTESFVADKCGVSVEHYRRWLAHYSSPVCQGTSGSGKPCAKPLTRVLKPGEFVAGLHDRCEIHKQVPRSSTLTDKSA
jgi:hypothetical protein